MKKITALLLVITMVLGVCVTVSASAQFTDLTDKHWAYANIQQLVSEGTIKGYPDGSFRPEATVTRAEFAKMFGAGTNKKSGDFKDLTSAHWSYSYVMASGVDADKEYFRPDDYMTRGEVLDALWDRCGAKVNAKVPGVIARQYADKDAVTWAYTTQLIKGNDGVDLRLTDTVTRAEVTALILRVRTLDTNNLKSITDNISDKLIGKINETLDLFEGEYSADKKVTYGQAAHAAMLLGYGTDEYAPAAQYEITFEGKYSYAMSAMTAYIWEKSKNTQEFANKNVTTQDALLAIMNAVVTSMHKDIPVGSNVATYSDAVKTNGFMSDIYMAYAYNKGIFNSLDGKLYANKEITMKEFLSLVIQADKLSGFATKVVNGKEENTEILKEADTYPIGYKNFGVILKDIPPYVYDNAGLGNAKDSYYTLNSYKTVVKPYIEGIVKAEEKKSAYKVDITYYPSLAEIKNNEVLFVLKLEFSDVAQGTTFASVLPKSSANTQLIEEGKTYYVLASSGVSFSDYIPTENTHIVKIIAAY